MTSIGSTASVPTIGVMVALADNGNVRGCQRVLSIRLNQTPRSTFKAINLKANREVQRLARSPQNNLLWLKNQDTNTLK
jgi:hypothetical protein